MPKPKSKAKLSSSEMRQAHEEAADIANGYKIAHSILDAAVTASLMSGLHPYPFEAPTAFWFLQWVRISRATSFKDAGLWREPSMEVFDTILDSIVNFAASYNGEFLPDNGEDEDYDRLSKTQFRIVLKAVESERQQRLAGEIVSDCVGRMKMHDIHPRGLEAAFLIVWLKVAALAGDIPKDIYFKVKRALPFVMQYYDAVACEALEQCR
ncbi:MAG: hypothetical protein JST01_15850 [Cyanobacteria bacterium SZAS TMP-1]|nr:hypothetical protein [Cyanobacteria bacterium SZAS TMP-1]